MYISRPCEYACCVIIEASWVQPTDEGPWASGVPDGFCLCFQTKDRRVRLRDVWLSVTFVGRLLRRQNPTLWEMSPICANCAAVFASHLRVEASDAT